MGRILLALAVLCGIVVAGLAAKNPIYNNVYTADSKIVESGADFDAKNADISADSAVVSNMDSVESSPKSIPAKVTQSVWKEGATLFGFFAKYNIPTAVYYALGAEDRELTSEIYAGARFYVLESPTGELLQALIPIGEEMQIHITKNASFDVAAGFDAKNTNFDSKNAPKIASQTAQTANLDSKTTSKTTTQNAATTELPYKIDFTPMIIFESTHDLALSIQKSPYQDIMDATGDVELAGEFVSAFKYSVNFNRDITPNDRLALHYMKKMRLGKSVGATKIRAAMVETNARPNYLFAHANGKYYDQHGKEIEGFLLSHPVAGARISSHFSLGRRHPILKIVRPHYGVDFAVRPGTKVLASAAGRVVFAGTKSGYGKVVEVAHSNGIKTLYAHLSSIGVRSGQSVKKGALLGKSGSSGLSTGPHLHFGVYKNNRPINPLGTIKTATATLKGDEKSEFLASIQGMKEHIERMADGLNTAIAAKF